MLADHQRKIRLAAIFSLSLLHRAAFSAASSGRRYRAVQRRYTAGWDALRLERHARMLKLGIVNCPLSKLDPEDWPSWNLSLRQLRDQIGPGEVGRAVPWDTLTAEQKKFQPIKMAIHAAMVHRMDTEIGRVVDQLRAMERSTTR